MFDIRRITLVGAILVALMGAMTGSASATTPPPTHISFKYEGWTPTEQATLESWGQESGPVMKTCFEVSGRPQHSLTITVVKNKPGEYTGDYVPGSGREDFASLSLPVFDHETCGHAIRDGWILSDSVWEEGLARTAEKEVMRKLALLGITEPGYDINHSYSYDEYYDNDNVFGVGVPLGNIYVEFALTLLRYEQGSYALGKAEIENSCFVACFNAKLFTHLNGNLSQEELVAMAAEVQPTVEGEPFAAWVQQQHIFDTAIVPNPCLFIRAGQLTVDAFRVYSSGAVTSLVNQPVTLTVINSKRKVIYGKTEKTSEYGWIGPEFALPATNERLTLVASTEVEGQRIEAVAYRQSGEVTGVFGVITNAQGGKVTFRSPSGAFEPQTVKVKYGSFADPALASIRGQIVAEYKAGRKMVTRTFDKDAAPYSLVLTATKPPKSKP